MELMSIFGSRAEWAKQRKWHFGSQSAKHSNIGESNGGSWTGCCMRQCGTLMIGFNVVLSRVSLNGEPEHTIVSLDFAVTTSHIRMGVTTESPISHFIFPFASFHSYAAHGMARIADDMPWHPLAPGEISWSRYTTKATTANIAIKSTEANKTLIWVGAQRKTHFELLLLHEWIANLLI